MGALFAFCPCCPATPNPNLTEPLCPRIVKWTHPTDEKRRKNYEKGILHGGVPNYLKPFVGWEKGRGYSVLDARSPNKKAKKRNNA